MHKQGSNHISQPNLQAKESIDSTQEGTDMQKLLIYTGTVYDKENPLKARLLHTKKLLLGA